uniref:Si:ch73-343l4.8 n=1 Tax=Sinocyclocheilus grahami TaxID=75366 RepID=A0A672QEP7_SINGR
MESGTFYVCRNINNRSGPRTQSHCQDEGKARKQKKQKGSRCLVWITVGLGLICVLLLVFIILQHITITFNQTINSLQDSYTDLMTEKHQLQNIFSSLSQKNLELETELRNVSGRGLYKSIYMYCTLISKMIFVCCICLLKGNGMLFISTELKSWSDSRQYCRDRGADLVIINTEEKQRFISSFIKQSVWIGLSDTENEGGIMKWVDNSTLKPGFWLNGEPNNQDGDEDCIELMPSNPVLNNWNDLPCSQKRKGFCEK